MPLTSTGREQLAVDGGTPVRKTLLPYGRQSIDETDIQAVVETLKSDWLTTGPKVGEFEEAVLLYDLKADLNAYLAGLNDNGDLTMTLMATIRIVMLSQPATCIGSTQD